MATPLLLTHVAAAVDAIRRRFVERPECVIVLGSGLGDLADHISDVVALPYSSIPHFAVPTAAGHKGQLVCGRLADRVVVALQGRFHLYEGHGSSHATLPIRVAHALGAERLIVSNAAGGLNPHYAVGDVMLIDDHIDLMFRNPLKGLNEPEYGPRFPDMSRPYDYDLLAVAERAARQHDFKAHRGVYIGMLGPTFETRSEYRMVRQIGGDAVGMSTVPEVIVARQLGMRVFGVSVITNACSPDILSETTHDDVVAASQTAAERMRILVDAVLRAA